MPLVEVAKHFAEQLPSGVGKPLAMVPYPARLGPTYTFQARRIRLWERDPERYGIGAQFARYKAVVIRATQLTEFYRRFYASRGFDPGALQSVSDWGKVPVVTKADLAQWDTPSRCTPGTRGFTINTGGTSGQPLEFKADARAFAREWAHMHHIWRRQGYRQHHLKLTLRGKHFDGSVPIRYNAVHNELVANASVPMTDVLAVVLEGCRMHRIRWIHGYPSLVAEFAHAVLHSHDSRVGELRQRLHGVLLGSEYPAPMYREPIAYALSTNIVSWYGHSEMAILAMETAEGLYETMPTYGYAEAVLDPSDGQYHLVVTSPHNLVHPFIRYDTGDVIEPISNGNGSLSFRIVDARVGEFITDRAGMRHSLTAIIFGRHHPAFTHLKHLQVRDQGNGRILLILTPRSHSVSLDDIRGGLRLDDLDIDWRYQLVDTPVRTASGKIKLIID